MDEYVMPQRNKSTMHINGQWFEAPDVSIHPRTIDVRHTDVPSKDFAQKHAQSADYAGDAVFTHGEVVTNELMAEAAVPPTRSANGYDLTKVFIVHGHDTLALTQLENFLRKIELSPVVLNAQANMGQTIIEKLESHTDVGFAVVLLTPDDKGGVVAAEEKDLKQRARQNVIFEFGYLVGKLGRPRVAPVLGPDMEKPSDIDGLVYTPMDNGTLWHYSLAKELRTAGIVFNADKLLAP